MLPEVSGVCLRYSGLQLVAQKALFSILMRKQLNHSAISLTILLLITLFGACKKDDSQPGKKPLYAVRSSEPGIFDSQGRFMILRGVNYNVLGDYWQANPAIPATKEYAPEDIRMMASYGFNCIRLLFNWSRLEPERGNYDELYIQQIQEVITEAAKYDM